ncbi:MAG: MopE-related protein [Pseudomonadota bacterium]|nr:MopE-related protein [Pseudomonadota bacterium]
MLFLLSVLGGCGTDVSVSRQRIDADGDGYSTEVDCDDAHATVHPDAPETCNEIDDDCDGDIDEDSVDASTLYEDGDRDGWGGETTVVACDGGAGLAAETGDCDDADADIHPGAPETCDEVDDDCDGATDEGVTTTFWTDGDGDGFGDADAPLEACAAPPGTVADASDCDDTDVAVNPAAAEVCDGIDQDCDGAADEGASGGTWYADADADGYGDATSGTVACEAPAGTVGDASDCDDGDGDVHPGASETCDGIDEDCDGSVDEGASDMSTWYGDADGDGWGSSADVTVACDPPAGTVADGSDCDDEDADPAPSGTRTWYADSDADGYGGTSSLAACEPPAGYEPSSTDCDDTSSSVNPSAGETCGDGVDQDCDGADTSCPSVPYGGDYAPDDAYSTKVYGVDADSDFAYALAAGDFDGDGTGDLVAGDIYATQGSYSGAFYGYYGPFTGGAARADANDDLYVYTASAAYDETFGGRLATLGDIDGDGADDLLVLGEGDTSLVVFGGDAGTFGHTAVADETVTCTGGSALGDWDTATSGVEWLCADYQDASNTGVVRVYSGTFTSPASEYYGESASDYAGWMVAGGDVDGDGITDIVAGATGDDDGGSAAGAAYVVYGSGPYGVGSLADADVKLVGASAGDNLGTAVHAGDMDGDGRADLLLGAPANDAAATNAGVLYLVASPSSGSVTTAAYATLRGSATGDSVGSTRPATADFDGDGSLDLLVGEYLANDGGSDSGAVWLVYGSRSGTASIGTAADAAWIGAVNEHLGYSVTAVPDADGDGLPEIAFGSIRGDEGSATNVGAVWVWPGR